MANNFSDDLTLSLLGFQMGGGGGGGGRRRDFAKR